MHHLEEHQILIFLIQLFVLLGSARLLGELFRSWKQPVLTAEILVGIFWGPSILGRFFPEIHRALFPNDAVQHAMLDSVAWFGVFLLLLETGLEIDFSIAWRHRGKALTIALFDIFIPIMIAFPFVFALSKSYALDPQRPLIFAFFVSTIMTISALPIAARVFHDLNVLKTDLGFLVISALTVNDVVGWVLFTIALGIFAAEAVSWGFIFGVFFGTVGFAALTLTAGRSLSTRMFAFLHHKDFPEPGTSLTVTVLLGLLLGMLTQKIGIHALFGFFIAGVLVGEARSISEQTRGIISQLVHSLFVPIFFTTIGLKIDLFTHVDLFLIVILCVVGILGRYLGAWLGAYYSKVPGVNRDIIAIGHTPGGMMEVVVAVLAVKLGLISETVFVAVVFSAVFSSVVMGPWLAFSLKRRRSIEPRQFLAADAIVTDLHAHTPEEAIRILVERLASHLSPTAADAVMEAAILRERDFSTALGHGIAVPHAQIDQVLNPIIAFGKSEEGIDWDSPDGAPVRYVFFVVTPRGAADVHVDILASIARSMADPNNRALLHEATDQGRLFEILQRILVSHRTPQAKSA